VRAALDFRRLSQARRASLAIVAGYFVVFLLLDWVSFIRPLQHLNITPWNPQAALAVALLLANQRLWWAVWASLVVADVVVRGVLISLPVGLATATALTLSYLAIAQNLRSVLHNGWKIAAPRNVALLVAVVMAGALLTGTAYVGILAVSGAVIERPWWEAFARYWVGDTVGIVVALPIVLAALDLEQRHRMWRVVLDWRWGVLAASVGLLLWGLWRAGPALGMDFSYLLLLPMVWAAAQFGAPGALLTAGVTQVGLIFTVKAVHYQDLVVFELQLLMAGVTITGLLLGVVVDKLQRADSELRRSHRLAAAGQMSAALAHELGQPLTALASYAQACKMLLQPDRPLSPDEQRQLAEVTRRIGEDAMRAGDIVHRLGDFFRRGAMQVRPTSCADLVRSAIAAQARRAESLGVSIHDDIPEDLPRIDVDKVQIEVVLRNLVANAIEASSARSAAGAVSLTASRSGANLLLEVVDDGLGVPVDEIDSIFDGVESQKPGGMGIGLSICRAIAEAHGGSLWAEPGPHGHFCLTLPIEPDTDD
jgi:two-component system sensor kinase FixL